MLKILLLCSFISTFFISFGYANETGYYYNIYIDLLFGRQNWGFVIFLALNLISYLCWAMCLYKFATWLYILYLIAFILGLIWISNLGLFAVTIYFNLNFLIFVGVNIFILYLIIFRRADSSSV
jgi:hypothetical protein